MLAFAAPCRLTVRACRGGDGRPVVVVDATALRPGESTELRLVYQLANGRDVTYVVPVTWGGAMQPRKTDQR